MLFPALLSANSDVYYEYKKEGWFWHKTREIKKKKIEPSNKTKAPEVSSGKRAVKQVEEIKEKTQELLSTAILNPTEDNLVAFMRHQYRLFELSDKFRKEWEKALLKQFDLDYTAEHPVSAIALQTAGKEEYLKKKEKINVIGKKAGLYFLFSSTCPYCIEQARILKHFEKTYGMTVFPLTIDNAGLNEYPAPAADTWVRETFNIQKTPALIMAYPQEGKMVPLSTGLITEEELIRRILLLEQIKQNEGNI